MTTTPDLETDLATRLVELLAPGTLTLETNLFAGPERPSTGRVPMRAVFVLRAGERQVIYGGGSFREHQLAILVRGKRDEYASCETLARAIQDALDLSGAFTGASGASYEDIRVQGAPIYLDQGPDDPHYFSINVDLWLDDG